MELGKDQRVSGLESIRGLAALLVILYHIPNWNDQLYGFSIVRNSYLMVELFFVLSGFVIYRAYSTRIRARSDLLRFQFLRFGRLYPVHLVFLVLFLLIEIAKLYLQGTIKLESSAFSKNSLIALVQQVFLVQSIWPTGNATTFNGPAWSISVEFYTYLLFGIIVLHLYIYRVVVFILLSVLATVFLCTSLLPEYSALLRCISGFFVGCLLSVAYNRVELRIPSIFIPLSIVAICVFLAIKTSVAQDPLMYLLSALLVACIAWSKDGLYRDIVLSRPLERLGAISYSLYMSHFAVIWFFSFLMGKVFSRSATRPGGQGTPQLELAPVIMLTGAIMCISIILGSLVYHFIEKPFRQRSRALGLKIG